MSKNCNFFVDLVDYNLISEWGSLLDRFFNDNKFDNWSSQQVGKLTKRIKRMNGINKDTYKYASLKYIDFPKKQPNDVKVLLGKSECESRYFLRHIINGIAHGKTKIVRKNAKLWVEIKDNNTKKQQTAYLFMAIQYIYDVHKYYVEIDKSNRK